MELGVPTHTRQPRPMEFTRIAKSTQGKREASSTNGVGQLGGPMQRTQLDPDCISPPEPAKMDLGLETVKYLEETTGAHLHDLGFGNEFLSMEPKAQAMKQKIG